MANQGVIPIWRRSERNVPYGSLADLFHPHLKCPLLGVKQTLSGSILRLPLLYPPPPADRLVDIFKTHILDPLRRYIYGRGWWPMPAPREPQMIPFHLWGGLFTQRFPLLPSA